LVQIETRWEEEVPQEVCLKEGLYEKLGLRMEDENAANAREEACDNRRSCVVPNNCYDEVVCWDELPDDMVALGD
jgi:hypothetical protein